MKVKGGYLNGEFPEPIKLNVCSGDQHIEGFISIDRVAYPGVHIVQNLDPQMRWDQHLYPYPGCLPFEDNSVTEVVASHCLEHFRYHAAPDLVHDWMRVLKSGGRIEISCPDFDYLIKMYTANPTANNYLRLIQDFYGQQAESEDKGPDWHYFAHYNCISEEWLRNSLVWWGADPKTVKRLPVRTYKIYSELRMEALKA